MAEFEKSRLTVALKMRGMTQRDLAVLLPTSSQYISMLERNIKVPTDAMLMQIAEALEFPIEFFLGEPVESIPDVSVTFRARRKMKAADRDKGLGASDVATSIITPDLLSRFRLPKIDVPDLSLFSPDEAAVIIRLRWGLGSEPIQNVVHLLESRGILVYWVDVDSESLDAFSLWHNGRPYAFLNSLKEAGDRGRFDAAHELGHLVLHQHINRLDDSSSRDIETEANQFASAFLLPEDRFRYECPSEPDFDRLYRLKAHWKVSIAAMIMRGAELGVFSEWQKRIAFQRLNATGMRTRERVPVQREQSKLHPIIKEALAAKGISPAKYAALLHLNPADFFKIMPSLAIDLTSDSGKIIKLASRRPPQ